jgi:hypothetical protein
LTNRWMRSPLPGVDPVRVYCDRFSGAAVVGRIDRLGRNAAEVMTATRPMQRVGWWRACRPVRRRHVPGESATAIALALDVRRATVCRVLASYDTNWLTAAEAGYRQCSSSPACW